MTLGMLRLDDRHLLFTTIFKENTLFAKIFIQNDSFNMNQSRYENL